MANDFITGNDASNILSGGGSLTSPGGIHALSLDEGYKPRAYRDAGGLAIGIGLNLGRPDAKRILIQAGLPEEDLDEVMRENGKPISEEVARKAFEITLRIAERDARSLFKGYDAMPQEVKDTVNNMSFQLGKSSLAGFTKSREFAEKGDWASFKHEILDSDWAKQTPERAHRVASQLDPLIPKDAIPAQAIEADPVKSLEAQRKIEMLRSQEANAEADIAQANTLEKLGQFDSNNPTSQFAGLGEIGDFGISAEKREALIDAAYAKGNDLVKRSFEKRKAFNPRIVPETYEEALASGMKVSKEEWQHARDKEQLQELLFANRHEQFMQGSRDPLESLSDAGKAVQQFAVDTAAFLYGGADMASRAFAAGMNTYFGGDYIGLDEATTNYGGNAPLSTLFTQVNNTIQNSKSRATLLQVEENELESKLWDMDRASRIKKSMDEGMPLVEATIKEDFGDTFAFEFENLSDDPLLVADAVIRSAPNILLAASLGKAATTAASKSLTKGMTAEAAKNYLASDVGKLAIARAGERTGIGFTAAQEGLSNGVQAKAEVLATPLEKIAELDEVKTMMKNNPGMTLEEARMQLSDDAFDITAGLAAVLGGTAAKVTGAGNIVGNLLNNVGKKELFRGALAKNLQKYLPTNTVARGVIGGTSEASEELLQGMSGDYATGVGLAASIGGKKPFDALSETNLRSMAKAGVHGLFAGAFSGGPVGAASGLKVDFGQLTEGGLMPYKNTILDPENKNYAPAPAINASMEKLKGEIGTPEYEKSLKETVYPHIVATSEKITEVENNILEMKKSGTTPEKEIIKAERELQQMEMARTAGVKKYTELFKQHRDVEAKKRFEEALGEKGLKALEVLKNRAATTPVTTIAAYSVLGSGSFENLDPAALTAVVNNETVPVELRNAASKKLELLKAKTEYDSVKNKNFKEVNQDIIYGGKNKLGAAQYDDMVRTAILSKDVASADKALIMQDAFTQGIEYKADLLNRIKAAQINKSADFDSLVEEYHNKFPSTSGTKFNFAAYGNRPMGNYQTLVDKVNQEAKVLRASYEANKALLDAMPKEGTAAFPGSPGKGDATPKAESTKMPEGTAVVSPAGETIDDTPAAESVQAISEPTSNVDQAGKDTTVSAETVVTPAKPILGPKVQASLDKAIAEGKGDKVIAVMKSQPEKYSAEKIAEAQRQVDAATASKTAEKALNELPELKTAQVFTESTEVNQAVKTARDSVRKLLINLNFKFVDSPDVNLSDIERIASKYLSGLSNDDPAFLADAAKALSYAIYFELGLPQGSQATREWLEESLLTWLKTGETPKVNKSIWVKALEIFDKILSVFSGKEFKYIENRLEKTLEKIVQGGDFSYKPKEGYKELDFQTEMDNNPLAVQSILSLMKSGISFVLTGSVAYADQVPVFRKAGKPLHDMDFLIPSKDVDAAYEFFKSGDSENWGDSTKLYEFTPMGKRVIGLAVVPKGYIIKNAKSFYNVKEKAPQRSYEVYNVETGKLAGKYFFLRGIEETFTGIAGLTIDLIGDENNDNISQTFKDNNGNSHTIKVKSYVGGFTAKLAMLRHKDINDFIAVIPPSKESSQEQSESTADTAVTTPETQIEMGLEDTTTAEEISSNSKGLLAALTNPTELAKKKGNLSKSYPVTVRGIEYPDAEAAYQALKNTATKDNNPQTNTYGLMVEILSAKLKQHPRLVTAITKKGGETWLSKATHQPTNKNTVWETGGKNWFIKALTEAYLGEQTASTEGVTAANLKKRITAYLEEQKNKVKMTSLANAWEDALNFISDKTSKDKLNAFSKLLDLQEAMKKFTDSNPKKYDLATVSRKEWAKDFKQTTGLDALYPEEIESKINRLIDPITAKVTVYGEGYTLTRTGAYIDTLKVDKGFEKNAGIGRKAVTQEEQDLKEDGFSEIFVLSTPEAIGFWEKMGFVKTNSPENNNNQLMVKKIGEQATSTEGAPVASEPRDKITYAYDNALDKFASVTIPGMLKTKSLEQIQEELRNNSDYTKEQKEFMEAYLNYAIEIRDVIKKVIKHRVDKNGNKLTTFTYLPADKRIRMLMNDNWDLPEFVYETMALAAVDWLGTEGPGTLENNDDALRRILGLGENDSIDPELEYHLRDAGKPLGMVFESLGKDAMKIMGLQVSEYAPLTFKNEMAVSIGQVIIGALAFNNDIHIRELPGTIFLDMEESADLIDEEGSAKFIKVNPEYVTEVDGVPIGIKALKADMSDKALMQITEDIQNITKEDFEPSETPPKKPGKAIKKTSQYSSDEQREIVQKDNERAYQVNDDVDTVAMALQPDILAQVVGVNPDVESLHITERKSVTAKNNGYLRSIRKYKKFKETLGGRKSKLFYLFHSIWANTRVGINNVINPQGDKFHRHMIGDATWVATIDTNDQNQMHLFHLALLEPLGVKIGKVDANTLEDKFQAILNDPVFVKAAKATLLLRGIREDYWSTIDINSEQESIEFDNAVNQAILEAVKKGGENTWTLHALVALGEYLFAIKNNKPFTTNLFREVDGITNGVILGLMQFGGASSIEELIPMLERGGIFVNGQYKNYNEFIKDSTHLDSYQDFGFAIHNKLVEMFGSGDPIVEAAVSLLTSGEGLYDEAKKFITKSARTISKQPLMTIIYGASEAKIINSLGRQSLYDTYKELAKLDKELKNIGKELDKILDPTEKELLLERKKETIRKIDKTLANIGQMVGGVKITTNDLLTFKLSKEDEKVYLKAFRATFGKALEEVIEEKYAPFLEKRKVFNDVVNSSFVIFKKRLVEQVNALEAAQNRGITEKELYAIIDSLEDVAPIVASYYSESLKEGLLFANLKSTRRKYTLEKPRKEVLATVAAKGAIEETGVIGKAPTIARADFSQPIPIYDINGNLKYQTTFNTVPSELGVFAPGVAAGVIITHHMDATIMMKALAKHNILNVHDAGAGNILETGNFTEALNEGLIEVFRSYDFLAQVAKLYTRVVENMTEAELKEYGTHFTDIGRELYKALAHNDKIREQLLNSKLIVSQYDSGSTVGVKRVTLSKEIDIVSPIEKDISAAGKKVSANSQDPITEKSFEKSLPNGFKHFIVKDDPDGYIAYPVPVNGVNEYFLYWDMTRNLGAIKNRKGDTLFKGPIYLDSRFKINPGVWDQKAVKRKLHKIIADDFNKTSAQRIDASKTDAAILELAQEAIKNAQPPRQVFTGSVIRLGTKSEEMELNGETVKVYPLMVGDKADYFVHFNKNASRATILDKDGNARTDAFLTKKGGKKSVEIIKHFAPIYNTDILGSDSVGINPNDYIGALNSPLDAGNLINTFDAMDNLGNVQEDPEHQNYLRNMLGTITENLIKPLEVYLLRDRPDQNVGEFRIAERIIGLQAAMKAGQKSLVSGLRMSMQEVFAHEVVHAITFTGINESSAAARRLKKLFNIVKQQVVVEDFMNHDGTNFIDSTGAILTPGSSAWKTEYALAKQRYDYIFNNTASLKEKHKYLMNETTASRNPYLQEFMAIGITNKNFRKKLQKIPVNAKDLSVNEKNNAFIKLQETLNFMIDKILGRIPEKGASNASEALMALMYELADQQEKAERNIFNKVDKVNSSIADAIDEWVIEPLKNKAQNITIKSNVPILSQVAGTVKALSNVNPQGVEKGLRLFFTRNHIRNDSLIYNVATDFMGALNEHKPFHHLARVVTSRLDHARKNESDFVRKALLKQFTRSLSKHEKIMVTRVGIMTGLTNLWDNPLNKNGVVRYTSKQMLDLLKDPAKVIQEIEKYEALLKNEHSPQLFNLYKYLSENLAHWSVHKIPKYNGDVILNAKGISELTGLNELGIEAPNEENALKRAKDIIEALSVLKALNITPVDQRSVFADLLEEQTEGVEYALGTYLANQEEALKSVFKGQELLMSHGFISELTSNYKEPKVATEEEGKTLIKYGYQLIGPINQEAVDPNKIPLFLFVSPYAQTNALDTGIVSHTNMVKKGIDQLHNYLQGGVLDDEAVLRAEVDFKHVKRMKLQMLRSMANGNPILTETDNGDTLIPVRSGLGEITGYRYVMSEQMRRDLLEKNESFEHVLGHMAGHIIDVTETRWANREAVKLAKEDFDANFAKDPGAYVWIHPNSNEPAIEELYNLFPIEMQEDIKEIWGMNGMYVHMAVYKTMFGQRRIGVTSLKYMDKEGLEGLALIKANANNLATFMLHNKYGIAIESNWKDIVTSVKDTIVIRGIQVLLNNILSNQLTLLLLGVNPIEALRNQKEAFFEAREYQKISELISEQKRKMAMDPIYGASKEAISELRRLEEERNSNKLIDMFNAGVYQSITEDVYTLDDNAAFKTKIETVIDKQMEKLPRKAQLAINTMAMRHGTPLYESLKEMTQLSDFMARYALHKHNMKKGMSAEESIDNIIETFINYDAPTDKWLQYSNDMGLLMFTKYFIRNQRVIAQVAKDRPASAAMIWALQTLSGFNLPDLFDSTIFNPPSPNTLVDVAGGFTEHPLFALYQSLVK